MGETKLRKRRILIEDATYHVTARANRNEYILKEPKIKALLLNTLKNAKKKYKFSIATFCIMNNHIHLMIRPSGNENLSRIMQWILSIFAVKYNKIFNYIGHVWYDRFHSKVIYNFLQYVRTFIYIGENPVKANIVKEPEQYEYSGSFHIKNELYYILDPPD